MRLTSKTNHSPKKNWYADATNYSYFLLEEVKIDQLIHRNEDYEYHTGKVKISRTQEGLTIHFPRMYKGFTLQTLQRIAKKNRFRKAYQEVYRAEQSALTSDANKAQIEEKTVHINKGYIEILPAKEILYIMSKLFRPNKIFLNKSTGQQIKLLDTMYQA